MWLMLMPVAAQDEREQTMSAPEGILPPGSAWVPATSEAWGGAARLRQPAPSLRDAMEQQVWQSLVRWSAAPDHCSVTKQTCAVCVLRNEQQLSADN